MDHVWIVRMVGRTGALPPQIAGVYSTRERAEAAAAEIGRWCPATIKPYRLDSVADWREEFTQQHFRSTSPGPNQVLGSPEPASATDPG